MIPILRRPRRHQARGARHSDSQHGAHEIIDQGIWLHGLSTWRTDRQQLESRTKQIKALAFKRCPVPFFDMLRTLVVGDKKPA
jgi:hypothetical protein